MHKNQHLYSILSKEKSKVKDQGSRASYSRINHCFLHQISFTNAFLTQSHLPHHHPIPTISTIIFSMQTLKIIYQNCCHNLIIKVLVLFSEIFNKTCFI